MHFIEEMLDKKKFLHKFKCDGKSLEECLFELEKTNISEDEYIFIGNKLLIMH